MRKAQNRAKAAGRADHLADRGDQIVGRTDDGGGTFDKGGLVQGLVHGQERLSVWTHQGADLIFIMPELETFTGLSAGLFAGLGNVPRHQHAPVLAVHDIAMLGGGLFGKAPLGGQGGEARVGIGANRQDAHAVLSGQRHARGTDRGGRNHRQFLLNGEQLQAGILQGEPVAGVGHALACQQAADHADGLILPVALGHGVDPQHVGV